ncbi:MAG: hypothetical protein KAU58_05460, partial [Candidatus Omnitrophica bacterium]|nr:hypothetical protein [Candidatus Omnitrophota bacterium]
MDFNVISLLKSEKYGDEDIDFALIGYCSAMARMVMADKTVGHRFALISEGEIAKEVRKTIEDDYKMVALYLQDIYHPQTVKIDTSYYEYVRWHGTKTKKIDQAEMFQIKEFYGRGKDPWGNRIVREALRRLLGRNVELHGNIHDGGTLSSFFITCLQEGLLEIGEKTALEQIPYPIARWVRLMQGVKEKLPLLYPALDATYLEKLPAGYELRWFKKIGIEPEKMKIETTRLKEMLALGQTVYWSKYLVENYLREEFDRDLAPEEIADLLTDEKVEELVAKLDILFRRIKEFKPVVEQLVGSIDLNDPRHIKRIGVLTYYEKFAKRFNLLPNDLEKIFAIVKKLTTYPEVKELIELHQDKEIETIDIYDPDTQGIIIPLALDKLIFELDANALKGHIHNLFIALTDGEIRNKLEEYYRNLGYKDLKLDPKVKDEEQRRWIWGTYFACVGMIEGLNQSYALTTEQLKETLDELLRIQNAAKTYWKEVVLTRQPGGMPRIKTEFPKILHNEEVQYFYEYIHALQERCGAKYKAKFKKDLTIEQIFKNIGYTKKVRMEAGIRLSPEIQASSLKEWETLEDRQQMLDYIYGNPQKGIKEGLMEMVVTDREAVYLGAKYMPKKCYDEKELLDEFYKGMYFQSIYMTHNKDEKGIPKRLQIGEIGELLTRLKRNPKYTKETVGMLIKYEAFYGKSQPLPTDSEKSGYALRIFELGKNLEDIKQDLKDISFIQDRYRKYTGKGRPLGQYALPQFLRGVRGTDYKFDLLEIEKHIMERRLKTTFREDIGTMDLSDEKFGELGNLLRFAYQKGIIDHERLLDKEEVDKKVKDFTLLESELKSAGFTPDEIRVGQGELLERQAGMGRSFTYLAGPGIYENDKDIDIFSYLKESLRKLEEQTTPRVISAIVTKKAREERRKQWCEKIEGEWALLKKYTETLNDEMEKRKVDFQKQHLDSVQREVLERQLLRKAYYRYGIILNKGEVSYLLGKMSEIGYTMEEALYEYVYLLTKVTQLYEAVYEGRELDTMKRWMISSIAHSIASKWNLFDSQYRKEIENRLGKSLETKMEEELEDLERYLRLAKHMEERFEGELNISFNHHRDALAIAVNAYYAGLIGPDADYSAIDSWIDTTKEVKDLIEAMGLEVDNEFFLEIFFRTDTWFRLGLASLPEEKEVDSDKVTVAVDRELARLAELDPELAKDKDLKKKIVEYMIERNLDPLVLKLYVDKVFRFRDLVKETRDKDAARDWISDRKKAAMFTYDICLKLSAKDMLIYFDVSNIDSTKRIGLIEIFGDS